MPGSTADTLFINTLFSVALEKKATDIHLMAGNNPVLRVDNKLYVMAEEKIMNVDAITAFVNTLLTADDQKRLLEEREVRTVYTWADRARFRASVYYQRGYPAISFRLIPQEIPTPKALMIPDILIDIVTQRQGLTVICGPFNSGRTTTMASLLQHVNLNFNKRIVTLERPIEYVLVNSKSLVNQREVGKDTASFTQGITDVLDDDVDVVAIADSSEEGISELLLTLTESGKVVIVLMNASSSISALEKFVGSVPEDRRHWVKDSLAANLRAVVNQRLVPAIGGGSVLAVEVLTMTRAVSSIIQEEKFPQLTNVLQTSREEGMVSLDFRLFELVRAGKISAEDARKYALDPSAIRV